MSKQETEGAEASPLVRLRRARMDAWHHVLRAWWVEGWIILAVVLTALGVAALYLLFSPVTHRLTAVVPLGAEPEIAAERLPEFRDFGWANLALLRDREFIAEGVPERLGYGPADLARRLQVETDPFTKTIRLILEDRSPDKARLALTALLEAYMRHLNRELAARQGELIARMQTDLERQREAIAGTEKQYRDILKTMTGIDTVLTPDQAVEPLRPKLEAGVERAISEEAKWQRAWESVAPLDGDAEALLAFPDIANHSSILFIRSRIRELENVREILVNQHGPEQPPVLQVHARLDEQYRILRDAALQFPGLLKERLDRAGEERLAAEQRLRDHEAAVEQWRAQGRDPDTLARQLGDQRAVLAATASRVRELEQSAKQGEDFPSAITVFFQPAEEFRVQPLPVLIGTGGFALAAGLLVAWLVYVASPRVRTAAEIEEAVGLPVSASLPVHPRLARWTASNLVERGGEPALEPIRALRARLAPDDPGGCLILVAGLRGREGATTVSAFLAGAFAASGVSTLLVDLHLRRPALAGRLTGKAARSGATDLALGIEPFERLPCRVGDRLDLLPAGRSVPSPGDLMGYPWFGSFAQEARRRYAVTVIDAAPLLEVADSIPVLGQVDHNLVVVRAGETSVLDLTRVAGILADARGPFAGFVLNQER